MVCLDDKAPVSRRKEATIRIHSVNHKMDTGDYALQGYENVVLIERKGSLSEIAGYCLTKDGRRRFISQIDRLKESASVPYVLLEGTPQDLKKPTVYVPKPHLALDAFQRILMEREVPLLLLPSTTLSARRGMGEWVARLLINGALTHGMEDNDTGSSGWRNLST